MGFGFARKEGFLRRSERHVRMKMTSLTDSEASGCSKRPQTFFSSFSVRVSLASIAARVLLPRLCRSPSHVGTTEASARPFVTSNAPAKPTPKKKKIIEFSHSRRWSLCGEVQQLLILIQACFSRPVDIK